MVAIEPGLTSVEHLLLAAEREARLGRDETARELLGQVVGIARTGLHAQGVTFAGSDEWRLFEAACFVPQGQVPLVMRIEGPALVRRIQSARQCFAQLNVAVQAARSGAQSVAEVATSFESLLDQVWRSEREWAFDDRLALRRA